MTSSFQRSLTLAFALVLLIASALSASAVVFLYSRSRTVQALLEREASELVAAERLRATMQQQVALTRGYLLSGDRALLSSRESVTRDLDGELGGLRSTADDQERQLLEHFESLSEEHERLASGVIAEYGAGNAKSRLEAQQDFQDRVLPSFRVVDEALNAYAEHQRGSYASAVQSSEGSARSSLIGIAGGSSLGLLLSGALAFRFQRKLAGAYREEQEAKRIAQAAVAARQELLGSVAHDLRNPLSAIKLKTHLLERSLSPGTRQLDQAKSIESVAARMQFLIDSLLDAASLEAGGLRVARQRVPAAELLDGAIELFEAQAAERQVGLERLLPDRAVELWGDRERLLQVLSNLIGNALKFTPAGGRIRLACEEAGASVRLSVADTGPGIRPEDLPHIFDRYWKRDGESSRRGAGLGLFIARGIVERHGGRISADSRLGRGTTFFFEVPSVRVERAGAEAAALG